MKLKLDDNGNAVLKDGHPVYVYDDGREAAIDVADMATRFTTLQADSKKAFTARDEAKAALKAFEGLDPEQARDALDKIGKLDLKKLVDAGQVDAAVAAALKPVQDKLDAESQRAQALEQQLHGEIVGGSFARSKYIAEKLAIPADMVQAAFGRHFAVADGKLAALDANGNPIYSRKQPGAAAEFDEALEILIDQYPHKDTILKADNKPGSGAPANGGGGSGGKTINRAAFDALDPAGRVAHIQGGGTVTD